jgi:hypothetical protein
VSSISINKKYRICIVVVSLLAGIPLASIWPDWAYIIGWGFADSGINPSTDLGVLEKLSLYGPLIVIAIAAAVAQLVVTFQHRKTAIVVSVMPLFIYGIGFYILKTRR